MVEGAEIQKPQYSIGILPDKENPFGDAAGKSSDSSQAGWNIEIIFADTLSEILPQVTGEYLVILTLGEECNYSDLQFLYHLMKENPAAGAYIYDETVKNAPIMYPQGDVAFLAIFLKRAAEGHLIYNMDIVRQLDIAEWLEEMKREGNIYVADYEVSCCSYLVSLASSVITGNRKVYKNDGGRGFSFRYRYVDGITALLNQWIGLVSDNVILDCYNLLVRTSFSYLERLDEERYVREEEFEQVRDYLLQGVAQLTIHWPYHGIRFEQAMIRKFYIDFMKKPRLTQRLKEWFYIQTGYPLDLEEPKTFNQKLNWMKLYDNQEIKSVLSDKYAVRAWVEEKVGAQYLMPFIAVWDKAEDIDFDSLPDRFVLKVNQGSGFNIMVTDKRTIDERKIVQQLHEWMCTDYSAYGMELQYKKVKPRVICEEYIENSGEGLHDYKIHVFHGKAHYVQYISGRTDKSQTAERWFDREWNPQKFTYTNPRSEDIIEKPECLDELLRIAEVLGSGFVYVRVDLYILNDGQIKFGEMTFTPTSGVDPWKPEEMDMILGNMLDIRALKKHIEF